MPSCIVIRVRSGGTTTNEPQVTKLAGVFRRSSEKVEENQIRASAQHNLRTTKQQQYQEQGDMTCSDAVKELSSADPCFRTRANPSLAREKNRSSRDGDEQNRAMPGWLAPTTRRTLSRSSMKKSSRNSIRLFCYSIGSIDS
jgi:hypothetical protein